jgi:hypothetical protein
MGVKVKFMACVHAFLGFTDLLFQKHMLVRRCSIALAWFTLIYALVFTFENLALIQDPAASVLLRLIEVSAAVVLYYHYRRDK